jgi:hypothetical protein
VILFLLHSLASHFSGLTWVSGDWALGPPMGRPSVFDRRDEIFIRIKIRTHLFLTAQFEGFLEGVTFVQPDFRVGSKNAIIIRIQIFVLTR